MPKKTFYLDSDKQDPLNVQWKGIWKNVTYTYQGKECLVIPNQKALKQGGEFTLDDGRVISTKLVVGMQAHLDIQVDGKPLSGTGGDPRTIIKGAAIYTWVIAGLMVILSIVLGSVMRGMEEYMWLGAVEGLIFGALGFWIWKGSTAGVIVTLILAVIQTVAVIAMLVEAGGSGTGGIVIKVLWVVTLIKAIPATRKYNKTALISSQDDILDA